MTDALVEAVAMVLMGRLMVSREDAAHIWRGMYEPEKEQFRREARAALNTNRETDWGLDVGKEKTND